MARASPLRYPSLPNNPELTDVVEAYNELIRILENSNIESFYSQAAVDERNTFQKEQIFSGNITAKNGVTQLARVRSIVTTSADDDAVVTIQFGAGSTTGHGLILIQTNASGDPAGLIKYRTGLSVETVVISSTGNLTGTTGVLTGTDGADGDLTISTHSDEKLYIENRLGGSRSFLLTFISAGGSAPNV